MLLSVLSLENIQHVFGVFIFRIITNNTFLELLRNNFPSFRAIAGRRMEWGESPSSGQAPARELYSKMADRHMYKGKLWSKQLTMRNFYQYSLKCGVTWAQFRKTALR